MLAVFVTITWCPMVSHLDLLGPSSKPGVVFDTEMTSRQQRAWPSSKIQSLHSVSLLRLSEGHKAHLSALTTSTTVAFDRITGPIEQHGPYVWDSLKIASHTNCQVNG